MLEALARAFIYIPALFLLGAIGFRFRYVERKDAALDRLATAAAFGLTLALLIRAFAHTYAAFGEDAFSWESFRTVSVESRWGARWRWQLFSAIAALVSLLLARVRPRLGWVLTTFAGFGLCVSLPLTGHAMALGPSVVALQTAHVGGAGLWIGTLFVIAAMGRDGFRQFAPLAMAGVLLLVTSGAVTAWLSFPTMSSVWQSTYGRLFITKIILVATVLGCGFLNWRHFRSPGSEGRRFVRQEIAFATLVLVLTGWLSETGTP